MTPTSSFDALHDIDTCVSVDPLFVNVAGIDGAVVSGGGGGGGLAAFVSTTSCGCGCIAALTAREQKLVEIGSVRLRS